MDARNTYLTLENLLYLWTSNLNQRKPSKKKTTILVTYPNHSLNFVYQMCRDLPLSYSCENHRYLSNFVLIIKYQVFCNLTFTYGGLNLCYL